MSQAIIRMSNVERETGYSRSTIYMRIKAGLFPKPVSIGAKSVGWPGNEVAAVNSWRIAGKSDDEIRNLVETLHNRRALLAE